MKHALITTSIVVVIILAGVLVWWLDLYPTNEIVVDNTPTAEIEEESTELLPIELAPRTVTFNDGTQATFNIDKNFELTAAAEGLGKARFMTMSPDGRLFVPDLVNYNLSHAGRLLILEDFDEETGQFQTQHTYLSGLRGPNDVEFYTDENGQTWLYLALTAHLVRYPYEPGDTEPSGEPETVTEFPNKQSPGEVSVVWHITRTLLLHDDTFYITVGSGCNACEELAGSLRAMVLTMNPDGSNKRMYAEGLRNAVGITWADLSDDKVGGSLYLTANGVDHLGTEAPDEPLYKITEGAHYGWPYCYELNGESLPDTSTEWDKEFSCEDVPDSVTAFTPRSAPLGLEHFENAHPVLNNTFLVALHGSFEPQTQSGYEIVRVTKDGEQEVFMDGFQLEDGTRTGRPVDIMQIDENSFFFTDDFGGRVYYVYAQE